MGASQVQMIAPPRAAARDAGDAHRGDIGMARALGESAPLLMIGMVAFIVDIPHGLTDPATVLRCRCTCGRTARAASSSAPRRDPVLLGFLLS